MYPDLLYDTIGLPGGMWIWIGILYALFDYIFNTIMCRLTGGTQRVQRCLGIIRSISKASLQKRTRVRKRKLRAQSITNLFTLLRKQFSIGSQSRLTEFHKDPLSWSWPAIVLLIPIAIYGISRGAIQESMSSLINASIIVTNYQLPWMISMGSYVQVIVWLLSLIISISSFYRYDQQRSKPTWFSKSKTFHLLRILLFDLILAYAVINTLILWLDYAITLYRILSDTTVSYNILYPDQMYGLEPAYKLILGLGFSLILFSLLPIVMILREKTERYSKIYSLLLYGGLVSAAVLISILVYKFDQRLHFIQQTALTEVVQSGNLTITGILHSSNLLSMLARMNYYSIIRDLPGAFPVPPWFQYLFSARLLLLAYEIYLLLSPQAETRTVKETIRRIIQKISD